MVLGKKQLIPVIVAPIMIGIFFLVIGPEYQKAIEENIDRDTFKELLETGKTDISIFKKDNQRSDQVNDFNEYKLRFNDEIVLSRINASGLNLSGIDL